MSAAPRIGVILPTRDGQIVEQHPLQEPRPLVLILENIIAHVVRGGCAPQPGLLLRLADRSNKKWELVRAIR